MMMVVLGLMGCGGWSHSDTARELMFATESSVDWAQSRGIVRNCDEQNPLVGKCGGEFSLNAYMPIMMIAHAAVSAALPKSVRHAWQYLTIGIEGGTVTSNWTAGYTLTDSPSHSYFTTR